MFQSVVNNKIAEKRLCMLYNISNYWNRSSSKQHVGKYLKFYGHLQLCYGHYRKEVNCRNTTRLGYNLPINGFLGCMCLPIGYCL